MTITLKALNAGNRTGDKVDVYRLEGVSKTLVGTIRRGEVYDVPIYFSANQEVSYQFIPHHVDEDEYLGEPQVLVCDSPRIQPERPKDMPRPDPPPRPIRD